MKRCNRVAVQSLALLLLLLLLRLLLLLLLLLAWARQRVRAMGSTEKRLVEGSWKALNTRGQGRAGTRGCVCV